MPAPGRPLAGGRPAGYSGRSMAQKLGLRDGNAVVLINAPARWRIPDPPTGIRLGRTLGGDFDVAIWFVRSLADLRGGLNKVAAVTPPAASVWAAWPRKAGGHESAVTQQAIRDLVQPLGLVDVKAHSSDG